jgi:hypothetical protein
MTVRSFKSSVLNKPIESITFSELNNEDEGKVIHLKTVDMQYHVYQLDSDGQQTKVMEGDREDFPAASHSILPSAEFHGFWKNLIYDSTIKETVNL